MKKIVGNKKVTIRKIILLFKRYIRMMFIISLSLGAQQLLAFSVIQQDYSECLIVDDISDTLLQFRQSGHDFQDIEVVTTNLSDFQIELVDGMIEDIQRMPIFQLVLLKDKVFENFKIKWNKRCNENHRAKRQSERFYS